MRVEGASNGRAAWVGCTEDEFATIGVVLFDEVVGLCVELLLGAIYQVNDGVGG